VSASSATVDVDVYVENKSAIDRPIRTVTEIYALSTGDKRKKVAVVTGSALTLRAGKKLKLENSVVLRNPSLWGPPPLQKPNLYVAITRLYADEKPIDEYETRFESDHWN
jgi:beta-galactosidase